MTKRYIHHVCVLGAGIVGLATAWALERQGHRVTVVDQDAPGTGASYANGGQLSYSHVQPLAHPSIWMQLPHLCLAKDSPLRWQWQADPAQWQWLWHFLRACRSSTAQTTTAALLQLSEQSRQVFETMQAQEGLAADFNRHGKLVLYPTPAGFAAARKQLALQQALGGANQQALSPHEARQVEPALSQTPERFAGAIFTPSECAIDALLLCQQLAQRLQQRGVRLLLNTTVHSLHVQNNHVVAANTSNAEVTADAYVMALGMGSRPLLRALGLQLPLYPLKGYSYTATLEGAQAQNATPHVSVTDMGRKVVFARLGQRLRVAGMVELVGQNLAVDPKRIAQLVQSTHAWWPEAGHLPTQHTWAGLRPATPTGLPWVGHAQGTPDNLILNTGHGALGLTLAFGSAQQVANQLAMSSA